MVLPAFFVLLIAVSGLLGCAADKSADTEGGQAETSTSSATASTRLGATTASAPTTLLDDNMSDYPFGTCYVEGQSFGNFQDIYNGGGSSCIVNDGTRNHQLDLKPQTATSPSETHAALTTTNASFSDGYTITAEYGTQRQLRTGSIPKQWEVGWLLWNYVDNSHFYNLVLKPNKWEIDKEYVDANGDQNQQFLASGTNYTFPIGRWNHVVVTQTTNNSIPTFTIKVATGGNLKTLATVTDNGVSVSGQAYTSGKIGFYDEDSETWFGSVKVTAP